jgi:hypothetical protein
MVFFRLELEAIDPDVGDLTFGIFGDHQPQGDYLTGIAAIDPQQGQAGQIHVIPLQHHLMAGGKQIAIGLGLDHIKQGLAHLHRLGQFLRGPGLIQQGQLVADRLQFLWTLHAKGPAHPL